jgi:carbon storage regulator
MLVLSRKPGERISIGPNVTVQVLDVQGSQVRIGIEAPRDVTILRSELREQPREHPRRAFCSAI